MNQWFSVEKIDETTFAISEYKHWEETHCYLLIGTGCAVLIDTGLGVSNIREVVDSLTADLSWLSGCILSDYRPSTILAVCAENPETGRMPNLTGTPSAGYSGKYD